MRRDVNRLVQTLLECQTPVVVVARGYVVGLGLAITLAADVAVVADDAVLRAPFATIGMSPDSGLSWLLPRLVGVARAKQMLLLGRDVSGAQAADWGLVAAAAPGADLDAAGEAMVQELAAAATVAVGLAKDLVHRGLTHDVGDALRAEAIALELASRTDDFKEPRRAKREARAVRFEGR
jgi:2-(1,2-epoxy-1,2-dihydrophenyl)acetyl-CoA isomerase